MQKIVKLNQAFLYCCMVVMFCLHSPGYAAPTQGKPVSLNIKNSTLAEILRQVSKKSGLYIYFQDADLAAHKNVTIDVRNKPVENVLHDLLDGRGLSWVEVSENTIAVKKKLEAEDRRIEADTVATITVTGKVVDEKGEPVIGATVVVKGSKIGTITNPNGDFILSGVNINAGLVISNVSFLTTELSINGRRSLGDIKLKDYVGELDETVVIAYGTTTRRINTGSVVTVKAADIAKQPVNNPLLALQGRVPGMTIQQQSGLVGAALKIQIRGQNSLNGSEPLYIIDGVPIDPNVLGGPTSLPGVNDRNNILQTPISAFSLINPNDIESIDVLKDADATSIYGSRGANGVILITTKKGSYGRPKINASISFGAGEIARKIKLLNARQYLDMRYEAYKNDGLQVPTEPDPSNYDLTVWDTSRATDWQEELIGGTANFTNAQLSVSGGESNIQYLVGGSYQRETSVSPGNFSDRKGNVHLNITGKSNDNKLNLQLTTTYLNDKNTLPGTDYTKQALTLAPVAPPLYLPNGELNWATLTNGNSTWPNPLYRIYQPYEFTNNNLISNFQVGYEIISGLNIKINTGYNITQGDGFQATPHAALRPEYRRFQQRNAVRRNDKSQSWIVEPQVSYERYLGKGKIMVLIGGSIQQSSQNSIKTTAYGFSDDETLRNFSSATSFYSQTASSEYKYSAVFSKVNYNLNNKYIANFTIRRDGSSRFGPGNQFGNFGAIGVAWIFSEENWLKEKMRFLSFGKLRGSFGTSGNDQISDYKYLKLYNYSAFTYQGIKPLNIESLYDRYFAWEVTKKIEASLEAGVLRNRILLLVNYYRNRSGNQLVDATLPSYVGPGSIRINRDAIVQNSGIEFSINTVNVRGKNFEWVTNLNFTINRNRLIDYPDLDMTGDDYTLDIGEPLNRQRVYRYGGISPVTGIYQFYDHNGKLTEEPIDPDDRVSYINTMPKYFGGISNTFTYKRLSIDFIIQFVKQIGRNYISGFQPGTFIQATSNQPISVLDRWQKSNDIATIQRYSQNGSIANSYYYFQDSNQFYSDASYVRLKNVSISYSLPVTRKSQQNVSNIQLFLQGQNLFTITKYKGLDPETQSAGSLPPLRVVTGGIKVAL